METVQVEQVKIAILRFVVVHPVWKNAEHWEHFIGFEPEENFFLQPEHMDVMGLLLFTSARTSELNCSISIFFFSATFSNVLRRMCLVTHSGAVMSPSIEELWS